jgi:nucleoside 2-deoxyribosyltransferase
LPKVVGEQIGPPASDTSSGGCVRISKVRKTEKRREKMTGNEAVNQNSDVPNAVGPYTIYSAGGLFTQDELATNIMIKEAVWRLSNGRFQIFLPQSREMQELDQENLEAYIRNTDLLEVVKADIILVRFDGLELDSGTVVEYMLAKYLGKPAVILRSDFRSVVTLPSCEPYNLMVKNWPRTVEIHLHSYGIWAELFSAERLAHGDSESLQGTMKAELYTLQKSVDEVARQVITAMETVIEMKSPYPPAYQEAVYQASRYCPGSGFDKMLTTSVLDETLQRLRKNGTL